MNDLLRTLELGSLKGWIASAVLPPVPFIVLMLIGVWILRRKDLAILDRFGRPGRQAGEFIRAHMIAIDSRNRMYTGEAGNGRRMQRWILKGTRPTASVKPPAGE